VYYFAIRFPNESVYLFSSLRFWFLLSLALFIILLVYVYSIYTIIQQKKYSELQRDFINNMTHEFKTPLSSILLASSYLNKQESITKDKKLEKYTQIIIDQSKKLNSHIEKILDIAKADNSPLEMVKTNVAILPILQEVIDNMQLKHQNLEVIINAKNNFLIDADTFHFTNIIYNLIDNSIKYCDENPKILINLYKKENHIYLDFVDNGIGVEGKNISFIFDKFYRVQSKKSNEVNGFGLGLFYVKKICTQHGWKIFATNNNDKGITISIKIPLKNDKI
jgi:two-component system phosphate regulon sensor histidine kinase PhoR